MKLFTPFTIPKRPIAIFAGLEKLLTRGANSLSCFIDLDTAKMYRRMRQPKKARDINNSRVKTPQWQKNLKFLRS